MPDERPRLAHAPIVEHPSELPERWQGGAPRFPVTAKFYVAVMRGELAHLIHFGRLYREPPDTGRVPVGLGRVMEAIAYEIELCAMGLRRYHEAWSHTVRNQISWGRSTIPTGEVCLQRLIREIWRPGQGVTAHEVAARVATREIIAECEGILLLWPVIELNFILPQIEVVPSTPPPASQPSAVVADTPPALPDLVTPDQAAAPGGGRRDSAEVRAIAVALAWAREGRKITIASLAREVGRSRRRLYDYEELGRFLESLKRPKDSFARGRKSRETGQLEAWEDDD
ncbi:hypothetical protein [Paludisphaera soli]|uniref:hypothetical protein n=1 Tax=Paludisphaera soli TaxID=2712865 RepID=UPI0013EBFDF4|nr:hypothetical protein [Paludisphaera soli]